MGISYATSDNSHLDADERSFGDAYTSLVNIVLQGLVPVRVATAFRSNLLLALPKSETDIRPIGIGILLRKVASKAAFKETIGFNKTYFQHFQFALRPAGMEEVVHSFNAAKSLHPDWDMFCIDADNAFNSANKFTGMSEVYSNFPKVFDYIRLVYLYQANQFYVRHGNIQIIPSRTGYHQGDVLGTWCYIMTIQPLLVGLSEHLKSLFPDSQTVIQFFVDDGNLCGPHEEMIEAVRYLQQRGPQRFGYRIKSTKGAYLIGKCGSFQQALERFQALTSEEHRINLSPAIVKIHPEDLSEGDAADADLPEKYRIMGDVQRRQDYGVKMLGAYVGSDEYVLEKLRGVIGEYEDISQSLMNYPLVQQRMLLFRYCFNPKPIHLLRTTPTRLTGEFTRQFLLLQKRIIESLFLRELDDAMMDWFCIPIDHGGLGIMDIRTIRTIAHTASVFGSPTFQKGYLHLLRNEIDHIATFGGFFRDLHEGLQDLKTYLKLQDEAPDEVIVQELKRLKKQAQAGDSTFLSGLYLK
jgi:hypothetical protein